METLFLRNDDDQAVPGHQVVRFPLGSGINGNKLSNIPRHLLNSRYASLWEAELMETRRKQRARGAHPGTLPSGKRN